MSQALIDKMRAAKMSSVEIDGHVYVIRRPTPVDKQVWLHKFFYNKPKNHPTLDIAWHFVLNFVEGWDFKEIDLIPGGTPSPAEFSPDILKEYLFDHVETLYGLSAKIFDAYEDYERGLIEDEKKPPIGLVEKA